MSALRDYQQQIYNDARTALAEHRSIAIQSATGSGKTIIFVAMAESVFAKNKTMWIIVTRKELMNQASKHLLKWGIPHGMIKPGYEESRAFKIHVVSSDTLIRRLDKIKNWPDLLIIDECHIMLDRQKNIVDSLPITSKVIGFSATMERTDGRGLNEVYEKLIEGPSIPWLTERGWLCELKYFSPPIDGIDGLKRRGMEYDEDELEMLLKSRKVYGKVIEHYQKWGTGRQALIFCRSVKSAERMAEQFREHGFKFYNIDGTMTDKYRFGLVEKLNVGEIDGICGCDVFIYGVDVPRVSYGAMIRPTLSKTVYFQSIGRILRPFPGKKDALFFDHVNNLLEHQEPNYPGIPPHYVPKIEWNFYGTEKKKKTKKEGNPKLCPYLDYMYCIKSSCTNCEHNKDRTVADARKPMVIVPTQLKEIKKPVNISELPEKELIDLQKRIGNIVIKYKTDSGEGPVQKMLEIADELHKTVFWAYSQLVNENNLAINVPLLAMISKLKGYKPGWLYFAKQKVQIYRSKKVV